MNFYPNPEALALRWQRQAEISYESGHRPLIGLGMEAFQAEHVLALLALRRLVRRQQGPVAPVFVVGGEGELWLLTALVVHSQPQQPTAPAETTIAYAGSDIATYAATLNLHAPLETKPDRALPAGMAWMLTPTAVPGSERSDLAYLPFVLAAEQFVPVRVEHAPSSWLDGLETWAVLLLALGLLVAIWVV